MVVVRATVASPINAAAIEATLVVGAAIRVVYASHREQASAVDADATVRTLVVACALIRWFDDDVRIAIGERRRTVRLAPDDEIARLEVWCLARGADENARLASLG